MPTREDLEDDHILNQKEITVLDEYLLSQCPPPPSGEVAPPLSAERVAKARKILLKILHNPKRRDIQLILWFHEDPYPILTDMYSRGAHAELVKLIEPLKALIHDVDDANKATLLPPVRAIGEVLFNIDPITMRAVYYGVTALLADERAYCADGQPWADAKTTLNLAWDGIGIWRA